MNGSETRFHIDGFIVQDCSISTVNALEILKSCTKPSNYDPENKISLGFEHKHQNGNEIGP